MKNYPKLKEVNSIADIDKIDSSEIVYLWYSDWWDGPVEGMLKYQNRKYRFQVFAESENSKVDGFFRQYLVIELTAEQTAEEEYWHTLFVEKVGSHNTPNLDGVRNLSLVKPRNSWNEFYDANQQRAPVDFSENRVIGYYTA